MNTPEEIASVETDLGLSDYQAFIQFAFRQSRLQKLIPWLTIGACVLLGIITGTISAVTGQEISHWIGFEFHGGSFLLGAFFAIVLLTIISRAQMRGLAPNAEGPLLGKHTISIREDGLFDVTKHGSSAIYWSTVRNVAETREHYFVMLDRNYGYIVPKRSFTTREAGESFIADIRARMRTGSEE